MTQPLLELYVDLGPTGWCLSGRHQHCVSGPPGIALSQGAHYACPCTCHTRGTAMTPTRLVYEAFLIGLVVGLVFGYVAARA